MGLLGQIILGLVGFGIVRRTSRRVSSRTRNWRRRTHKRLLDRGWWV